jgi:transcriptional regulator with XRE-family HTH domain
MNKQTIQDFKNRLRSARRQKFETQRDFAKALGEPSGNIQAWETLGNAVSPPLAKLPAICRALNISADFLLGLEEDALPTGLGNRNSQPRLPGMSVPTNEQKSEESGQEPDPDLLREYKERRASMGVYYDPQGDVPPPPPLYCKDCRTVRALSAALETAATAITAIRERLEARQ